MSDSRPDLMILAPPALWSGPRPLGRLHAAALPELKRRLSLRRAAGSAVSSGASPTSRRMVVATLHLGRSGYGH